MGALIVGFEYIKQEINLFQMIETVNIRKIFKIVYEKVLAVRNVFIFTSP